LSDSLAAEMQGTQGRCGLFSLGLLARVMTFLGAGMSRCHLPYVSGKNAKNNSREVAGYRELNARRCAAVGEIRAWLAGNARFDVSTKIGPIKLNLMDLASGRRIIV
jgi:hypothetical protein